MPTFSKLRGLAKRQKLNHATEPDTHQGDTVSLAESERARSAEAPARNRRKIKRFGISTVGDNNDNAAVDVVCIHGLSGHPEATWLDETLDFFWPEHLSHDIRGIRTMTFGYDADPTSMLGKVDQNRLADHALSLLNDISMERERTNTESRPLFFVVHSLGGLVLKKALCTASTRASADAHLQAVGSCTKGIIFMGTPHAGSNMASWADAIGRILQVRSVNVNKNLINTLKSDSEVLRDVNDQFGQLLERHKEQQARIQIKAYHEEVPIGNVGLVVPLASASILEYTSEGIHANHMVGLILSLAKSANEA